MVVVGFLWRIIFSYNNGPVNHFLEWIGVPRDLLPQWLGVPALIIPSISVALIWLIAGYYSIIYHAGMMSIPMSYYEVSAIEGANKWQEFVHVTMPFLAPSITINTVLLTVESLSAFAVPASMTGGGGPGRYGTTLALWSYTTYFNNHQYGKAIAISVLLGVFAVIPRVHRTQNSAQKGDWKRMKHEDARLRSEAENKQPKKKKERSLSWQNKHVVSRIFLGLFAAFVVFPIILAVLNSFKPIAAIQRNFLTFDPATFTLAAYDKVITVLRFGEGLWNNVVITLLSTLMTVVLGSLMAFAISLVNSKFLRTVYLTSILFNLHPDPRDHPAACTAAQNDRAIEHLPRHLVCVYGAIAAGCGVSLHRLYAHAAEGAQRSRRGGWLRAVENLFLNLYATDEDDHGHGHHPARNVYLERPAGQPRDDFGRDKDHARAENVRV